jgi:chromosome segregation protein
MLRLRDVEIQGFKSFAEKTRIPFPGDILVVVGPNGAGKSNVTDAVLWALGEQSAKALRGKKMEDVIFNGTPKRPPAGSAQVLITFEDTDGTRYQVGRRLLRSGDSSYLMDGRTVRLKDVHDFLMRYAISTQGNYLVEQGEVAALLKANPEERRMIFEEVAGIAHFKENRRSAFSKLESTQANLLRLNDIIMEVETQMGSLKRQAAKADRFVRLSDELRDRRRAFWGRSFGKLTAQRSALSRDLALLTDERQRRETALNRLQSDQEQAALRLSEHEASLSALIESIHTKDLEHERAEQEIKRRTEQIANANGRIRQIGGDREDLRKRVVLGEKELERLQEELAGLESDEASAKGTADGALTTLEAARAQVAALEERRRTLNQQSFEQAQEKARLSSELKSLEDDLRRLDERERRIDRERDGLTARQQGLAEALETRTNERERAAEVLETTRRAREEAEQRAETLQSVLEHATAALAEAKQRAAAAESRLAVLRSHEAALRSSAHAFLKERDAARVKKTLAEALARVPADLVPALSAALGDLLEGYVDTDWEGLPDLLAALQSQKAGEAVFYVKGAGQSDRRTPDLSGRKGFEGWLHEAQGVPKGLKEHLPLAALCADAASARALAQEARVPAVSRGGLYAHPDGWVRGGSGGKGGATLLEHERDRVAAESDHDAAILAVTAATEALDKARAEREAARAALESARPAEAEAAKSEADLSTALRSLQEEHSRLESALELNETEGAQAREEREEWEPNFKLKKEAFERAGELMARGEAQMREADEALAAAKASQDSAHEAVAETRARWSEVNQRLQACRETLDRARQSLKDLGDTDTRLAREADGHTARVATLSAEMTEADRTLRGLLLNLEELRRRKVTFEEELQGLQGGLALCGVQVKDAREALEETRAEVQRHEVALAGVEADLRNLVERVGETFEETPEALAQSFLEAPPLSDEERETEQKALAKLEQKITELGAVNMLAREEYDELEKRFGFLSEQRKDLEEAVANLQETIRKINKTTRERFMEAFEAVREHFAHLFKEVFEGGEARLSLQDEQNPLDTGVEIFAQPPGKKLQHLDQLSGGEKAMVAIALLFSLFRYRPQPFFILDEVDAPLDEANVHRFNRLLAQFRGQTQFVVVTHNKTTMEMAEVLYGVTMPEGGVSRVVSVRLAEVEEQLGLAGGG